MFFLSKTAHPEHSSHFKLVKHPNSIRVNDFLLNEIIPNTLFDNLLPFRDTNKKFELEEEHLKKLTNRNYNVDLINLSDGKLLFEFAEEVFFDDKAVDSKSTRDTTLINMTKSLAIMARFLKRKLFSKQKTKNLKESKTR